MWGERFWDELLEFILRTQNHRSPAAGGHVTHLSSQNLLTVWCQSSTACWGISTWTEACRPTNPTSTGAEAASVNNNVSEPAVIIRRNSGCCFWFQTGGLPHVRSMANVSAVSLWGVSLVLLAPWFHFSDTLTSMKNENTLLHRDCGTVPLLVSGTNGSRVIIWSTSAAAVSSFSFRGGEVEPDSSYMFFILSIRHWWRWPPQEVAALLQRADQRWVRAADGPAESRWALSHQCCWILLTSQHITFSTLLLSNLWIQ